MAYKNTTEFVKNTSREYSIYVCQSRGIPYISDGLKDAQRKALFVMKSKTDKLKVISLAGQLISENIYLHGDASACDTISLMAAPYCNNIPLLSGIGAFGTRVGPTDWGAPRYTYVKKSSHTESLIYQDYDIIPLKENYDGSVMEPKHFLPLVPLVLLNGVSGIAVGWSTKILPRSFIELVDATLAAIDKKKKLPNLLPTYEYLSCTGISLGDNSYEFFGKVKIDGSTVTVTSLPPDLSLEKFKIFLNKLEDDDKIQTYVDRSTKEIHIEVRFRRGTISGSPPTTEIVNGKKVIRPAVAAWTDQDAITFLKLRSKSTERIVVLNWDGNNIKQYVNAEDLIREFVEWRLGFYTIRYTKLIETATLVLNFNTAVKTCYDKGFSNFLSKAQNKLEIVDKISSICSKIPLDESQIDRIASMASYRWAKDSHDEVVKKIAELQQTIIEYQTILSDPDKIRSIYRQEVVALKKLGSGGR